MSLLDVIIFFMQGKKIDEFYKIINIEVEDSSELQVYSTIPTNKLKVNDKMYFFTIYDDGDESFDDEKYHFLSNLAILIEFVEGYRQFDKSIKHEDLASEFILYTIYDA